ncbi:Hypothetical_protein [Hexamita inflata]|uniref:Hypothetical_protein n=1 Tax=Hexamita inflata TaxID=28002 RepID=A0AA86TT24_9EUKA|nr:Hypothetical protein HINF_LOCUS15569 [Hexamita inflata]CAI9927930.1 Hypothetical protein HINF_LOCUS15575 [Hexamita inflata]
MTEDQYEKERLINELKGETLDKIGHYDDNDGNSRQRKLARTFLSKTRQDGVDYENKFGTYDEITPRIAFKTVGDNFPTKLSVSQPTPDSSKKMNTQSQHHAQTVAGKTHHTMKQTAKRLKNTIQVFTTKSSTTSNKSQDNTRQQKSQKRIIIASMTVQNPISRQTTEAKEATQTLESRGTKKSTIKQRSNATKGTRLKQYQLQWAKTARCTKKVTSFQRN